jgi:eukaryotic-like serine/threonine-protein kinase
MPSQDFGPPLNEPEPSRRDRLESWKEIAAHMGRGVTTVQRWELEEGLPVHRLPHAKKGSVFAFKRELDSWRVTRVQTGTAPAVLERSAGLATLTPPESRRGWLPRPVVWVAAGLVGVLLVAVTARFGFGRGQPRSVDESAAMPAVPRPFANDPVPERSPSLSPDGTHVVYDARVDGVTGLYIKAVDGGSPRKLVVGDGIQLPGSAYAKWSPRGDLIAFLASEGPNRFGLYVIPPGGGALRHLTSMAGIGLCWHPDGSSIGFVDRNAAGEPFSVFSVALETGQRRRLTVPPPSTFGDTYCSFSPDGRQLAVVRHAIRNTSDLYVADAGNAAADRIRRLTVNGPGMEGLAWSPDGQSIVVGSPNGLWKVATSGSGIATPVLVTGVEGETQYPSFSVTGPRGFPLLAYEYRIYDVNIWRWDRQADGSGKMYRLPGSAVWEDFPAFSPDGRRIAFVSNRTGKNQVWTANADGADPRQITFHALAATSPQWSPDGQRIAFSSQVDGNWDIYVVRSDGSDSTRLTWDPSLEEMPSWSRDGRWIYFRSDRTGFGQLWKTRLDGGGAAARVTTGAASQGFESPDGHLLYFVRSDNAPGLWSVPVGGGPETFVLPEVQQNFWAVADDGIAFVAPSSTVSPKASIRLFSFASRKVSTLAVLRIADALSGFSITRDSQSAIWPQPDASLNDLMLIDPWKQ